MAGRKWMSFRDDGHPTVLVCHENGSIHDVVDVIVDRLYLQVENGRPLQEPGGPGYTFWSAAQEALEILSSPGKLTGSMSVYDWHLSTPQNERNERLEYGHYYL